MQSKGPEGAAEAEVLDAARVPLPNMWPAARRVSQVRHLPHLLPKLGE
jgi:hypothetical protein